MYSRITGGGSPKSSRIGKPEVSKKSCVNSDAICSEKGCEICTKKTQDIAWKYVFYNASYDLILKHGEVIAFSYRTLDGLNLSYAFIKCLLEVVHSNSKDVITDVMHDFLMTPEGIIAAIFTTVFFVTLSVGVYLSDDKILNKGGVQPSSDESVNNKVDSKEEVKTPKNRLSKSQKDFLDVMLRWVRGIVKSFKNAFKGFRTLLQLTVLFGTNANFLLLPFGLVLCATAIANRLWTLRMQDQRKKIKKNNDAYLERLLAQLDGKELQGDIKDKQGKKLKIQDQSTFLKWAAMVSASYSGLVNSPYLYLGFLVALCAVVSWPVFVAMVAICSIYAVLHIATSVWEEKNYQRDQEVTTLRAELAEAGLALKKALQDQDFLPTKEQERVYKEKLKQFTEKHTKLKNLRTLSTASAIMYGLFNGLAVYRAIAGFASIALLISAALPPAFLVVCLSIGLISLLVCTLHSYAHYKYHRAHHEETIASLEFLSTPAENAQKKSENIKALNNIIHEETGKFAEELYVKDGAEIFRLTSSGFINKGDKLMNNYLGNPGLEADEKGHYNENPSMFILAVICSIAQAIVLPLYYCLKLITSNPAVKKKEAHQPSDYEVDSPHSTNARIGINGESNTEKKGKTTPKPSPRVSPSNLASPSTLSAVLTSPTPSRVSSISPTATPSASTNSSKSTLGSLSPLSSKTPKISKTSVVGFFSNSPRHKPQQSPAASNQTTLSVPKVVAPQKKTSAWFGSSRVEREPVEKRRTLSMELISAEA